MTQQSTILELQELIKYRIDVHKKFLNEHQYNTTAYNNEINMYNSYLNNIQDNKFIINTFKIEGMYYFSMKEQLKIEFYKNRLNAQSSKINKYCNFINKFLEEVQISKFINYNNEIFLVFQNVNFTNYLNCINNNIDLNNFIKTHYANESIAYESFNFLQEEFKFNIIEYKSDIQKNLEEFNKIIKELKDNLNEKDNKIKTLQETNIKMFQLELEIERKHNALKEQSIKCFQFMKKDSIIQNEKIRNLELEVHYLKSQIEKKVEIDYEMIKERNKNLNNEFKRVMKLMKFKL